MILAYSAVGLAASPVHTYTKAIISFGLKKRLDKLSIIFTKFSLFSASIRLLCKFPKKLPRSTLAYHTECNSDPILKKYVEILRQPAPNMCSVACGGYFCAHRFTPLYRGDAKFLPLLADWTQQPSFFSSPAFSISELVLMQVYVVCMRQDNLRLANLIAYL
ncbi:hypothetical protein HDV63DRAFT_46300 [Trichoderma sp. SZMC 28014]